MYILCSNKKWHVLYFTWRRVHILFSNKTLYAPTRGQYIRKKKGHIPYSRKKSMYSSQEKVLAIYYSKEQYILIKNIY